MIKKILIPIDFQVASLNTLKYALEANSNCQIEVVLLYSEYLSSSITDLLFYSSTDTITHKFTDDFRDAVQIIKNRYSNMVNRVSIELFHGFTSKSLNNLLLENEVSEIYLPKSYRLRLQKNAFNSIPLLKKSKLPVFEIDWNGASLTSEKEQLVALFN